jgi:hypothetical protein
VIARHHDQPVVSRNRELPEGAHLRIMILQGAFQTRHRVFLAAANVAVGKHRVRIDAVLLHRLPELEHIAVHHQVGRALALPVDLLQEAVELRGPARILHRVPSPVGIPSHAKMRVADQHQQAVRRRVPDASGEHAQHRIS